MSIRPSELHLSRHAWLAAVFLLLLAACDRDANDEAVPRGGARMLAATAWDTVWIVGGAAQDSLLLMPGAMTSTSQQVYVADLAAARVLAFNAADGTFLWTAGRKGAGPGEFRDPRAIAALPDGGVVVADIANARLSFLSADGRSTREVPFPGVGYVSSMCALSDGSVLLGTMERERPLVLMGADGSVRERFPLPWSDLDDAHPIVAATVLGTAPDHSACVLALARGRGFAVFRDGRFTAFPYREQFDLPDVEVTREGASIVSSVSSTRVAARDVELAGDSVFVTFEGESDEAGRLVDVYSLPDGKYRHSHRYSASIHETERSGDTFFLLHEADGYPVLVAARVRESGN